MLTNGSTEARKLRSRLNHPIIDADGHWIEYGPVMREEFRKIGGGAAGGAPAIHRPRLPPPPRMSPAQPRRRPARPEGLWSSPRANALGRAPARLPRLP